MQIMGVAYYAKWGQSAGILLTMKFTISLQMKVLSTNFLGFWGQYNTYKYKEYSDHMSREAHA